MSAIGASAEQGLRPWLARAFFAALAVTTLAYGSVSAAPLNLAASVFALLAGLSHSPTIATPPVARMQAGTIALLAALVVYVVAQALPFAAGDFANEAWKSVNDLVGPVQGTISVAPGMTLAAITSLALPFLVFIAGLALFQGDIGALRLWRFLAYFGVAYAAFGILQELFFPDQLLFEAKRFYVGSLTATFVNRNSAGTFFGLALLLNLGLFFYHLKQIRVGSLARRLLELDVHWPDNNALLLLHALFCVVAAVALFLTQSRGAAGASFVGAVVSAVLAAAGRLTADKPSDQMQRWRRYAGYIGGVIVIVGLFALFAGRSIYRMEEAGSEDGRWCSFASTIEAIKAHPIFGSGFGTFQDVFPAYRNAECAGIFGVWDRAHNFFLEGYLGLGLPFAVALLAGYAALIGALALGLRNRHLFRFAPATGLGSLVLVTLHSTVDFSLQIPGVACYFAAFMAAAVTASLGRRQD